MSSGFAARPGKAAHNKLLAKAGQAEREVERQRERDEQFVPQAKRKKKSRYTGDVFIGSAVA